MFYNKRIQRKVSRTAERLKGFTHCNDILILLYALRLVDLEDYSYSKKRIMLMFQDIERKYRLATYKN